MGGPDKSNSDRTSIVVMCTLYNVGFGQNFVVINVVYGISIL